jgi:hypothetical protein
MNGFFGPKFVFLPSRTIIIIFHYTYRRFSQMGDSSGQKSLAKVLMGLAAVVMAVLLGRKVVKEVHKKRTREEY